MICSDFHVHTHFSSDSNTPAQAQIEALIAKGITEICITDHHDIGYRSEVASDFSEEKPFRINPFDYFSAIQRLVPLYQKQAKISIGVELGLRLDYHHSIEDFAEVCDWDFIIGSAHVVDDLDPYYPTYWQGKSKKEGISRYYQSILDSLEKLDCFDVLGHLDYIVRYAPGQKDGYSWLDYQDLVDAVLKKVISMGKGIECNTAGLKYGLGQPNPEHSILKRYRELGGEILTIGSDAHKPEHVAYGFDLLPQLLMDCGFRYYTIFHRRKAKMQPL